MKARALELARGVDDPVGRLNMLREYTQATILRSLHESQAFQALSFVGGTALRFLYDLQRFSEDLDFSVESGSKYDPGPWVTRLERDLTLGGFETTLTWNDHKTVHVGWVRIAGLLQEVGLAPLPEQKLSVKIEIDTRPPAGADTENRLVNRHFLVAFRHHGLPSLMAGKVHALIARSYPKGRDWYDLLWYRSRSFRVEPNHRLLQAALDQTEGAGAQDATNWRAIVRARLKALDVATLRDDVSPFLERQSDAELLTAEHLGRILEQ